MRDNVRRRETTPSVFYRISDVDPLETLWTGSLEEGRFNNVAAFEYVNLMGSAHQFDVDRQRYLCRAG
jgi:hypothetical protein